ncbi:MAG: hypothetical protein ACRD16_11965, partial [Thermoanaerobaculia bacterium]
MRTAARFLAALLGFLCLRGLARAGFPSEDVFLPAVGRIAGQGGAQFFTTVWATNLTEAPLTFTFEFLRQGQANPTPASFSDTLESGETKTYENVVETRLGLTDALGAAHVVSSGDILVAERIFNQAPGTDLGDTQGLFFAGVPKSFSISLGQSASIQGLNQGSSENFRYNFALVETGGSSTTVNVQIFDASGTLLGQKAFVLLPFEQLQPNVADVVPGFSSINARLTATVTGGTGSVLVAGAQVANVSQDSSGFEMSFPTGLLVESAGAAVVTSLNGLTGAVTLRPGNDISITHTGNSISIAATGGPLNLPFFGSTTSSTPAFAITNNEINGVGIQGTSSSGAAIGVLGVAGAGSAVPAPASGIRGDSLGDIGVIGTSGNNAGVLGSSSTDAGIKGLTDSVNEDKAGVLGIDGTGSTSITGETSAGVRGESKSHVGVQGLTDSGIAGVLGV